LVTRCISLLTRLVERKLRLQWQLRRRAQLWQRLECRASVPLPPSAAPLLLPAD